MPRLDEKDYRIKINNLGYTVHIIFSNDIKASWLKRFNTDETGREMLDDAGGLHTVSGGGHSFVILPKDVGVASMCHECWHAVYAMFKWAGIPLDNNELVAYTLGYVISEAQAAQTKNDRRLKCRTK